MKTPFCETVLWPQIGLSVCGKTLLILFGYAWGDVQQNDLLEICAAGTRFLMEHARAQLPKATHLEVMAKRDPKAPTIRLVIGAMRFGGLKGRHLPPRVI